MVVGVVLLVTGFLICVTFVAVARMRLWPFQETQQFDSSIQSRTRLSTVEERYSLEQEPAESDQDNGGALRLQINPFPGFKCEDKKDKEKEQGRDDIMERDGKESGTDQDNEDVPNQKNVNAFF